jgi:hypothetical protein
MCSTSCGGSCGGICCCLFCCFLIASASRQSSRAAPAPNNNLNAAARAGQYHDGYLIVGTRVFVPKK